MLIRITSFCLLFLQIITFSNARAQQEEPNRVMLLDKKNSELPKHGSSHPDSVENIDNDFKKRGSGILVTQNKNGIVFKSHLRDYDKINVELWNPKGDLIYNYSNKLSKNIDYNISLGDLPNGRYILNFIFENKLIVCNVIIDDLATP